MTPLAELTNVHRHFKVRRRFGASRLVRAVDGVSLTVEHHEAVGLVGESGSGKTTVARLLLGLLTPTAGNVAFQGQDIATLRGYSRRVYRRSVQAVFQDPYSSLNPRHRLGDIVAEPLLLNGYSPNRARARVEEVMEQVGLGTAPLDAYPHQFSGGQRQRIAIARALAGQPKLIVLDEPVASLDVSIRSQVINLLSTIKRDSGVSYLLISHDLATTWYLCDRIFVVYAGRIVEAGSADAVYHRPQHPYTKMLIAAARPMESAAGSYTSSRRGEPPDPRDPPSGCRFHPRCPIAVDACRSREPTLVGAEEDVHVACLLLTNRNKEDEHHG